MDTELGPLAFGNKTELDALGFAPKSFRVVGLVIVGSGSKTIDLTGLILADAGSNLLDGDDAFPILGSMGSEAVRFFRLKSSVACCCCS